MKELIQAGNFYESLSDEQREDLEESIAADIFFLDDELQQKVVELFKQVNVHIAEEITRRNTFKV